MDYYTEIKNVIENKEVNEKVRYLENNKETIKTYFEIGRLLIEAQGGETRAKYGDNLIKKWSKKLVEQYGKGYSQKNLKRMRKFYSYFKDRKRSTVLTQLSWSHWNYILSFDNENERNYYINRCIENNLSVRGLINEIKTDSFNRLSYVDKKNIKLIGEDNNNELKIEDMLHDPIIINIDKDEELSEKVLKKYILKELEKVFLELGTGFTFVGSEYKVTYDNKNYFIDLLFFNYKLNRFMACELKKDEVTAKDIGQTLNYMKVVDKTLKEPHHNKTIGIIISKKNNKLILEYVSDLDIFITTYKLEKIKEKVNAS